MVKISSQCYKRWICFTLYETLLQRFYRKFTKIKLKSLKKLRSVWFIYEIAGYINYTQAI